MACFIMLFFRKITEISISSLNKLRCISEYYAVSTLVKKYVLFIEYYMDRNNIIIQSSL